MALTKIGKEGITGISNSADATFLTATSSEGVTLAGTLAVTGVHTVGTNAVATSDGGAVTTSVVQGLTKSWCKFNGTSTLAINDSFNISTVSDVGTGNYSPTFTNNMSSEHFSAHATKRNESTNTGAQVQIPQYATNLNNIQMHESDSTADSSAVSYSVKGDLA